MSMIISNNVSPVLLPKSSQINQSKQNTNVGGFKSSMIKRIQYARAGCGSCGG